MKLLCMKNNQGKKKKRNNNRGRALEMDKTVFSGFFIFFVFLFLFVKLFSGHTVICVCFVLWYVS